MTVANYALAVVARSKAIAICQILAVACTYVSCAWLALPPHVLSKPLL